MDIRQPPHRKCFQSFFCCPDQQDVVSRPFWTLQPLCSLGGTKKLCAEMLKGTERALRWLYGAGWTQLVFVLSPFLNKSKIWCNVKMRKTQGSPQMHQHLKAGDKNEFKTWFSSPTVQKEEKSEHLSSHSCPFRSYTQHSGGEHANPPTVR